MNTKPNTDAETTTEADAEMNAEVDAEMNAEADAETNRAERRRRIPCPAPPVVVRPTATRRVC